MEWNVEGARERLMLLSAIILLLGLSSAVLIYLKVPNVTGNVLGYDCEGGSEYPIMPDDSKQYLRGLELYGGTANVLMDELRRWFSGLWHGKSLAYLVAFITIVMSAGALYAANHLPSRESQSHDDSTKCKSG